MLVGTWDLGGSGRATVYIKGQGVHETLASHIGSQGGSRLLLYVLHELYWYTQKTDYQYNDRRSGPPASPPVSFNIHKYKSIPYHYTLLTCVTVVVRTTTVLTRKPHTHSLRTR